MDSVFQSYLEYLPEDTVLKKYGKVDSIFEQVENPHQALLPIHYGDFRDEIEELWNERKLKIQEVSVEIKSLNLTEHSMFHKPNEGAYFLGRLGGNYCSISFDKVSQHIKYFQFGIDITKRETRNFVASILIIAKKLRFYLLGSNLDTFEANWDKLDKYFRRSPAYKFIKSEEEFLRLVESGIEKTDVPFLRIEEK